MQEKHLQTLEYHKILEILATYSKTYLGKELCNSLLPSFQKESVAVQLSETEETIRLRYRNSNPPIEEIAPIDTWIKQIQSNITISPVAFLQIGRILKMARELKFYFQSDDSIKEEDFPNLSTHFENIYTNRAIEEKIFSIILDENTIADSASSKLKDIRRKIHTQEQGIKDKLNSYLSSHSKYIQESVITIRNNRYVIPVKEEYRNEIKGFIHAVSASGSTVFIEPISIFELNNTIANLKMEESIEIEKILSDLTNQIFPICDELLSSTSEIGYLDFLFAKANYAISIQATIPVINTEKYLEWKQARHPLISVDTVVPIDISLGKEYSSLVITGPNTGGKTVTLKTIGLLSLMAMSGLAIPVLENSSVFVFDGIYADIGDEQSIGESLSTFSSHLLTIISILKEVTENSLVLVDELGSGTDPIEGSSLAISILEDLSKKKILTVATTHYPEIKNYALTTKGFENASCEFDVETLSPTYRLLVGVPGKSNAFAISKRLGLPENILQRATDFLEKDTISTEELLKSIYDNKLQIEKEKEEIEKNLAQVTHLRKNLERDTKILEEKENTYKEKAKLEARELLLNAKAQVADSIRQMRDIMENGSSKELEHIRNQLNNSIQSLSETNSVINAQTNIVEDLHVGQEVLIPKFNQTGTVLSISSHTKQAQVQIGSMKTMLSYADVVIPSSSQKKETKITSGNSFHKAQNISTEINVIGQNVEEATFVIDKYLDDCVLAKVSPVRIVHGKGTGKLREGIHSFLKKNTHVKNFRLGIYGEGETGVTIVELKI